MNIFGHQMDSEFDLYLESYTIPSPDVQTDYKRIPGRNGAIDRTEKFGTVFFRNREWKISLKWTDRDVDEDSKVALEKNLLNAIHGKSGMIIFDDDPSHYWYGRAFVSEVYCENNGLLIAKIELITDPFKYGVVEKSYTATLSSSAQTIALQNGRKVIMPKVVVSSNGNAELIFTVRETEYTRQLTEGTWRLTDLVLYEGTTNVSVTGSGTLTISYEDAQL